MKSKSPQTSPVDQFLELLRQPSNERGVLVLVDGEPDLSGFETACIAEKRLKCRTVRYVAKAGDAVVQGLLSAVLVDLQTWVRGKPGDRVGAWQTPPGEEGRGPNRLIGPASQMLRTLPSPPLLRHWAELQSALRDRPAKRSPFVIFCEIDGLGKQGDGKHLGLDKEIGQLLNELPTGSFLVLSGVPGDFSPPSGAGPDVVRITNAPSEAKRQQCAANDLPEGPDQLNVANEVFAIADAIALKDLRPPLVVGILGGWGAGKSFAIHLIEERLLAIRSRPLIDEAARDAFPYVGHPYVIKFDAWTYAKSNLWASLMQVIFVELDRQISIEQWLVDNGEDLGTSIGPWTMVKDLSLQDFARLKELDDVYPQLVEAMSRAELTDTASDRLWSALNDMHSATNDAITQAEHELSTEREKLETIRAANREKLKEKWEIQHRKGAWKALRESIGGELFSVLDQAREQARKKAGKKDEVPPFEEIRTEFKPTLRLWRKPRHYWMPLLVFLLASLVILVVKTNGWIEWQTQTLLHAVALIGPYLAWIRKANEWLLARQRDFDAALRKRRDQAAAAFEAALASEEAKHEELNEGSKRIGALEANIEGLRRRVGLTAQHGSVLDFVRRRVEDGDYAKHLGLVHQVQQDLDELSRALLTAAGAHREKLFPRGKPRIVLMIDDLDRCPPHTVVEVLETAQLLVKTELFVVVLAMDTRYVTRALEKTYEGVLVRDGLPSGLDYIEKIVQIPYRTRPIDNDAIDGFLADQMDVIEEATAASAPEEGGQPLRSTTRFESPGPWSATRTIPDTIAMFKDGEPELLADCLALVSVTPRSAKRLVNVFKLWSIIWWHRDGSNGPQDEIKRVMLLLLTLAAAYPACLRRLLDDLHDALRAGKGNNRLKAFLTRRIRERRATNGMGMGEWDQIDTALKGKTREQAEPIVRTTLCLKDLGVNGVELVHSFSFVGEVDPEEPPAEVDVRLSAPEELPVGVRTRK